MRKMDFKNTMLENQIALLDNKVAEVSDKITSAENKQIIAYEEKRKAILDYQALQMINKNLESIIESHEREKQRLMGELKKFTKGKLRSNVLEAELDRKDKQNQIVKRGCEVSKVVYTNLDAPKSTQTDIAGLKGNLIMLNNEEYAEKFCKVFSDAMNQTDLVVELESTETMEDQSRNANGNVFKTVAGSRSKTNTSSKTTLYYNGNHPSRQGAELKPSLRSKRVSADKSEDRSIHNQRSRLNASQRTRSQMFEGDHSSQHSRGKASSSKGGSIIRVPSFNHPSSLRQNHLKRHYDFGVQCDLLQNYHEEVTKLNNSTLPTSTKRYSPEQQHTSASKLNPITDAKDSTSLKKPKRQSSQSQLISQSIDRSQGHMATLAELYPDEQMVTDEDVMIHESKVNPDGQKEYLTSEVSDDLRQKQNQYMMSQSIDKRRKIQALRNRLNAKPHQQSIINNLYNPAKHAKKISEAWEFINYRIAEIEAIERRNSSQIKYEVDKAFEMAKYFQTTNLSARDPATSEAYTRIVKLCIQRLDQLTPVMILKKLEEEISSLQKQCLPQERDKKNKGNQPEKIGRILNFVCLENLNKQIVKIFNQAINETLQSSIVTQSQDQPTNNSPAINDQCHKQRQRYQLVGQGLTRVGNSLPRDLNSINIVDNINNNSINNQFNHSKSSSEDFRAHGQHGQKSHTPLNMLRNFVISQPLQSNEHEVFDYKKMSHSTADKLAQHQLMRSTQNSQSNQLVLQPLAQSNSVLQEHHHHHHHHHHHAGVAHQDVSGMPRPRSLGSVLTIKSTSSSNPRGGAGYFTSTLTTENNKLPDTTTATAIVDDNQLNHDDSIKLRLDKKDLMSRQQQFNKPQSSQSITSSRNDLNGVANVSGTNFNNSKKNTAARLTACKQFTTNGVKSLLTLQKLQPGQDNGRMRNKNSVHSGSDKKLRTLLFRDKMRYLMNNSTAPLIHQTLQNGTSSSQLFKQQQQMVGILGKTQHSRMLINQSGNRFEDDCLPDTDQIINEDYELDHEVQQHNQNQRNLAACLNVECVDGNTEDSDQDGSPCLNDINPDVTPPLTIGIDSLEDKQNVLMGRIQAANAGVDSSFQCQQISDNITNIVTHHHHHHHHLQNRHDVEGTLSSAFSTAKLPKSKPKRKEKNAGVSDDQDQMMLEEHQKSNKGGPNLLIQQDNYHSSNGFNQENAAMNLNENNQHDNMIRTYLENHDTTKGSDEDEYCTKNDGDEHLNMKQRSKNSSNLHNNKIQKNKKSPLLQLMANTNKDDQDSCEGDAGASRGLKKSMSEIIVNIHRHTAGAQQHNSNSFNLPAEFNMQSNQGSHYQQQPSQYVSQAQQRQIMQQYSCGSKESSHIGKLKNLKQQNSNKKVIGTSSHHNNASNSSRRKLKVHQNTTTSNGIVSAVLSGADSAAQQQIQSQTFYGKIGVGNTQNSSTKQRAAGSSKESHVGNKRKKSKEGGIQLAQSNKKKANGNGATSLLPATMGLELKQDNLPQGQESGDDQKVQKNLQPTEINEAKAGIEQTNKISGQV